MNFESPTVRKAAITTVAMLEILCDLLPAITAKAVKSNHPPVTRRMIVIRNNCFILVGWMVN